MQYTLKKELGQHFLHDENVCQKIVEGLGPNIKNLVEVGPGGGAITKYLMNMPFENYLCIELDKEKMIVLGQAISGITVEQLKVGMPVELVLDTLHEDEESNKVIWKWKPIA